MLLCSLMLIGSYAYSQDPEQYGIAFSDVPDSRDAVIYQVNIRCFSSTRDLQGVMNRLDHIKALGVNVLYLMPVYPVGTDAKSIGSPYCIKDFRSVDAEFGTLADLRDLVDAAHNRGMAVMLDWVANQTSWDHPWITAHKEWYNQDGNGNILHLNTWTDVAGLNFSNSEMCDTMIQNMRYWIFTANIDGFRCDYADNPPIAFWQKAIASLRGITTHKLLLLAEGSRSTNYTAGFDYNFGFHFFFNTIKPIYTNSSSVTLIDNSNSVEYVNAADNNRVVRYLTNHDAYPTYGSPFSVFGGKAGTLAAFVVTAYMKSVPFIYNGMEVGNTAALPFPFNFSVIDWTQDLSVTPEMTDIISLRNNNDAIRRGTLTSYDNDDVCAFRKTTETDTVYVFSNLRNDVKVFTLPTGIANTTRYDAFTNTAVNLEAILSLSAYQYRVFVLNGVIVPVTGVTVSPKTATIAGLNTQQLTAAVTPENATYQGVTWTSSNTSVATVSQTGLVTAVGPGVDTIVVKTNDQDKTDTCIVTVSYIAVTDVAVSPDAGTLATSGTLQLSATVSPANATNPKVSWSSSDTNIAIVNSAGLVTGISAGTAAIIVTTEDQAKTDTCQVTVTNTILYYQINNRWKTTTYLNDDGDGKVTYGTNPSGTDYAYHWQQVSLNNTDVQFKNRITGNYMHIENTESYVECGTIEQSWYSAQWSIVPAGDWNYIENKYQPAAWIHIESQLGYAQYENAETGWWSAMWQFIPVPEISALPGVEQVNTILISPNPATNGYVFVELTENLQNATMKIFDLEGRNVFEARLHASKNTIFLSSMLRGMYIVKVSGASSIYTQKLLIE
jgi:glycosidase